MLYAVLCYNDEKEVGAWSQDEEDACMARLGAVQSDMKAKGRLGPVARLMPTTAATTLRKTSGEPIIVDGPFAETKEQFLGFFVAECETLDDAVVFAKDLASAHPGSATYEIRPLALFNPSDVSV
jgi:hypothetical protein